MGVCKSVSKWVVYGLDDSVKASKYPIGKWKIASLSFDGDEIITNFRCTKCRAISKSKTLHCPTCNEYMAGDPD